MTMIALSQAVTWKYLSKLHQFVCRINGEPLTIRLQLFSFTSSPPDVLEVETWLVSESQTPTTVEEVAIAASRKWSMRAEAEGETATHGLITAEARP